MLLLSPMDIEAGFPLVHFLGRDPSLVSHSPDHVYQFGSFGDLVYWYGFVVTHPFMAVKLNSYHFDEFIMIMGFHRLVPVQYVWVVGCGTGNRVFKSFLDCILRGGCWHVLPFILVKQDFPSNESLISLEDALFVARVFQTTLPLRVWRAISNSCAG